MSRGGFSSRTGQVLDVCRPILLITNDVPRSRAVLGEEEFVSGWAVVRAWP
jgi:hypothetical protein